MYDSHVLVVFINSEPALNGNNFFLFNIPPTQCIFHQISFFVVRKECALSNRGACGEVKVAFSKGNCTCHVVKYKCIVWSILIEALTSVFSLAL